MDAMALQRLESRLDNFEGVVAELGDHCASLQVEVKDQQEAIDTMMDMLEKTITVEVRTFEPAYRRNACSLLTRCLCH
jgi:uncharacterized coiled-coil protein SlyX